MCTVDSLNMRIAAANLAILYYAMPHHEVKHHRTMNRGPMLVEFGLGHALLARDERSNANQMLGGHF